MRFTCLLLLIAACVITSCVPPPEYLSETAIHATVQAAVATAEAAMRTPSPTGTVTWTPSPSATPSSSPTATQTKVPSPTPTVTLTPTAAPTPTATRTSTATPTLTATQTRTPTLTLTPAPGRLNTAILGCTTGLDVIHGLGEVTNAYARVRNVGGAELTNVCLTLNANDEGKKHPDKTYCIPSLRPNYEVTTKLTVDTEYGKLTLIEVAATANQGTTDKVSRSDCRALSNSELNQLNPTLNVPKPIQGP